MVRRNLLDWEVVKFQGLVGRLYKQNKSRTSQDSWRWMLGRDELLSVQSYYHNSWWGWNQIFHTYRLGFIWHQKCVLFYLASNEGTNPENWNLRKRRITNVSWSYMCKCSGEDADYLLCYCQVATCSCCEILRWDGLQWRCRAQRRRLSPVWHVEERREVKSTEYWALHSRRPFWTWELLKGERIIWCCSFSFCYWMGDFTIVT